jgi:hypothetical protein
MRLQMLSPKQKRELIEYLLELFTGLCIIAFGLGIGLTLIWINKYFNIIEWLNK